MPRKACSTRRAGDIPAFKFAQAELPDCAASARFDNVLCETVIMHLEHKQIAASVRRLLDIVKPSGILYLSWRVTEGADHRDAQGRLYAAFDAALVLAELKTTTVLLDEEAVSASSGKKIHRLVVKKPGWKFGNRAAIVTSRGSNEASARSTARTGSSAQRKPRPEGTPGGASCPVVSRAHPLARRPDQSFRRLRSIDHLNDATRARFDQHGLAVHHGVAIGRRRRRSAARRNR